MDVRPVVLTAGDRIPIKVPGRFFMLIEAPSPITVRFKKSLSTFREVARNVEAGYKSFPGDWADLDDRFDGVEFESAIAQTIVIGISDRAADYQRVVGVIDVRGPNAVSTTADATAGVASGVAVAVNANRRFVHIQNVGAAAANQIVATLDPAGGAALSPEARALTVAFRQSADGPVCTAAGDGVTCTVAEMVPGGRIVIRIYATVPADFTGSALDLAVDLVTGAGPVGAVSGRTLSLPVSGSSA